MITNVYVDGMNLFYGCLKQTPYKWLDLVALSKVLMPRDQIHTVRYFTAKVSRTPTDPLKPIHQAKYLRALATIPELQLHFGRFSRGRVRMAVANPPPNTIEVIKNEEKGSDVNLATYLLRDAYMQQCEQQVVITNDSDLAEPIRLVRQELRMRVGIVNPHPLHKRTPHLHSDFARQIREAALVSSQLPPQLKDAQGTFTKPSAWS